MIKWSWTLLLVTVLTISCTSSSEPPSEQSEETPDWTTCINQDGFLNLVLASQTTLPEGRSEEVVSLGFSNYERLSPLLVIVVSNARLHELNVNFEEIEGLSLDSIYTGIRDRLDGLYEHANPTEGYSSWRAATRLGTLMEIELMDARSLFQRNEIIVHWKEYEDRLYED